MCMPVIYIFILHLYDALQDEDELGLPAVPHASLRG